MLLGQFEHGVAEQPTDLALGRDEVGGACRVQDVLVGSVPALLTIGIQQCIGRVAVDDGGELPRQVLGVLHARVGAARAEGRHPVRRVPGEAHAAVAEAVHAQAGEGVDARPFQIEGHVVAQQRLDAGNDPLGFLLFLGVGVPAELEVDAPDVVRLHVEQHALVAMEHRVEPEPALRRAVQPHLHVGDQEAVLELAALALQAQQTAHGGAAAVARRDVVGIEFVGAVGRLHRQPDVVGPLDHPGHAAPPAQIDQGQLRGALGKEALDVILLQVDEGRPRVAGFGQQVEAVDLLVPEEDAAHVPGDALVDHAVAAAEPVEDLQRALGEADGARAGRQRAVVVQQHHRHAALRQVDGERQPDRTGAHDHHRAPRGRRCVLIGMAHMVEHQLLVVDRRLPGRGRFIGLHGVRRGVH